jgi:hypothetical protein
MNQGTQTGRQEMKGKCLHCRKIFVPYSDGLGKIETDECPPCRDKSKREEAQEHCPDCGRPGVNGKNCGCGLITREEKPPPRTLPHRGMTKEQAIKRLKRIRRHISHAITDTERNGTRETACALSLAEAEIARLWEELREE